MSKEYPFIPLSAEEAARFPSNLERLGHPDPDPAEAPRPAGYCCDGFQQSVRVKAIVWYPCSIGLWFVYWPEPQPVSSSEDGLVNSRLGITEKEEVFIAGRLLSFCPDCGFQWATMHRGLKIARNKN